LATRWCCGTRHVPSSSIVPKTTTTGTQLTVYPPRDKLLIEADSLTPGPPNGPASAQLNPNNTNLVDNLAKLNLAVDRILPLHGRVVPASELYAATGAKPPN